MIAEMVVIVAGKQRKDEASPQFAEVAGDIVPELPDAVGEQRVSARIALRQAEQGHGGNEGNAILADAIKSGDDRDAVSNDRYEPMFRRLNARLRRERQRENFTRRNVPRVIGFGKLRHCESFIRQAHCRLWTRATQRRTSAKEKP